MKSLLIFCIQTEATTNSNKHIAVSVSKHALLATQRYFTPRGFIHFSSNSRGLLYPFVLLAKGVCLVSGEEEHW